MTARVLSFDVTGRQRKWAKPKSKQVSHFQFSRWSENPEGGYVASPRAGAAKSERGEFPLIATTILNPSTGTETLVWLHFDLDFDKADKTWCENDLLSWPKISEVLAAEAPVFFKYLTRVTRSSGGRGLSLALAVSPLELIEETAHVQALAHLLQSRMIQIMSFLGLGVDEGARGLNRLMPNPFRESHALDCNEIMEREVQVKRPRVIQEILVAVSRHKALRPQPKREQRDLLWPNRSVEPACARLYLGILDEAGPFGHVQLNFKEFRGFGFSRNTAYKILASPPRWLKCEAIAGEGYRLSLCAEKALSDRAELVKAGVEASEQRPKEARVNMNQTYLPPPARVLPGERHKWLVSAALCSKWKGIELEATHKALKSAAQCVPSYDSSLSLKRELSRIVGSIYRHSKETFGQDCLLELPSWLENELSHFKDKKSSSQVFVKKGSVASRVRGISAIRRVKGRDGAESLGDRASAGTILAMDRRKIYESGQGQEMT